MEEEGSKEWLEREQNLAAARAARANARKAEADADTAREATEHEKAKTRKTAAEAKHAASRQWTDTVGAVAGLITASAAVAAFFWAKKK